MQTFRTPVDTREVCEASARYVTADDFAGSVILLALGVDVVNVEELKNDTIEAINQALSSTLGRNPCSMKKAGLWPIRYPSWA
jgi:hypothetical protein